MEEDTDMKFTFDDMKGKETCCVPVTPGVDHSPKGTYSIELKDGDTRLILVADKYQAWFRGFVTHNGARFEIDKMLPKIMARSSSLYTEARYYHMLGKTVAECKVGYQPLLKSLHSLAGHDVRKDKDYMVAIAVLIVMLFEAPRFPAVFELNMNLLEELKDGLVGDDNEDWITNWSTKSWNFYVANGEREIIPFTEQTNDAIEKVASGLRILCRSMWDSWLEMNDSNKKEKEKFTPGASSKIREVLDSRK